MDFISKFKSDKSNVIIVDILEEYNKKFSRKIITDEILTNSLKNNLEKIINGRIDEVERSFLYDAKRNKQKIIEKDLSVTDERFWKIVDIIVFSRCNSKLLEAHMKIGFVNYDNEKLKTFLNKMCELQKEFFP